MTDRRDASPSVLHQLTNRYLQAAIDPTTGLLSALGRPGDAASLARATVRYYEKSSDQWCEAFELRAWRATARRAIATLRLPHLDLTLDYRLPSHAPLLQVNVTARTRSLPGQVRYPELPRVVFGSGFVNVFEDEDDLYCDGAELPGGRQLPCWRVFFQESHRTGLLLATRSKAEMGRFDLLADGFALRTHTQLNYHTMVQDDRPTLDAGKRRTYTAAFELGPWARTRHAGLLKAARLLTPTRVATPPARGRAPRVGPGVVLPLAQQVPAGSVAKGHHPRKWLKVSLPWTHSQQALVANTGVKPAPVVVKHGCTGPHRVCVGVGNGRGAALYVPGEAEPRFRISGMQGDEKITAFGFWLSGKHVGKELDFGVIDLNGKPLKLGRYPDLHQTSTLDYLRLEPLSPRAAERWRQQQAQPPKLSIQGLNDIPDIAPMTDALDPDPAAYAGNIAAHAAAGFDIVHWRIDGQCCDYPSKLNTMRYVSAKVHGVFNPQAKAYGRVLRKVDMLQLAVEAAQRHHVQLYGWMRFNSYMGNVASAFYREHPDYWEEWDNGRRGGKLCLALPEVRQHKIGILVEAARYGLQGLTLGFLRHPPVLQYHPVMCAAYAKQFGQQPPRDPKHPDPHHRQSLPRREDPAYERWWAFRAQYLTTFGRELKQALRKAKLDHVKIALWVRPNHCLFDGIDLPAWLDEGLCDTVISDFYASFELLGDLYWDTPAWRQMVRQKAQLIRGLPMQPEAAKKLLPRALAEGYDGICSYESDFTVLDNQYLKLYESLRR